MEYELSGLDHSVQRCKWIINLYGSVILTDRGSDR